MCSGSRWRAIHLVLGARATARDGASKEQSEPDQTLRIVYLRRPYGAGMVNGTSTTPYLHFDPFGRLSWGGWHSYHVLSNCDDRSEPVLCGLGDKPMPLDVPRSINMSVAADK